MPQPRSRLSLARMAQGQRTFYRLATILLVVSVLYFAQAVLLPLFLAVLVAFALTPIADWLERHGLGRVPSALLAGLTAAAVVGGVGWLAVTEVQNLARDLPKYKPTVFAKLDPILNEVRVFDRSLEQLQDFGGGGEEPEEPAPPGAGGRPQAVVVKPGGASLSWVQAWVRPFATAAGSALLVTVLSLFLLVQRESVRDRLIGLAGRRRLTTTTRALEDAARRVSKYLLLQLATNATMGLIVGVGLTVIGVPYAPLWGLLTAALRFLPYVGIWLSALFPFTLAAALFPDWGHALLVLALYGGFDLLMTNAVEPLVFGHGTGVSSLALLVAAVFWAWLWGPVGLLLAIPMTVCVVVLGEHVPSLKFFTTLLGAAPAVAESARFYHRALAHDTDAAAVQVGEVAKDRPLIEVYDEVILPALAQAKTEREQGDLDPEEERRIYRTAAEMLDGVLATYRDPAHVEAAAGATHTQVVGCATKGEADRLALRMLRDLVLPAGCDVSIVPAAKLIDEVMQRCGSAKDVVACVAAVSPGGLAQAAGLCKQLKVKCPQVRVLVGRWGMLGDTSEAATFFRKAGVDKVTWTLRETAEDLAPGSTKPADEKKDDPLPDTPAGAGKVTVPA